MGLSDDLRVAREMGVEGWNEVKRLQEALNTAWGEAYLGTLAGEDTPDPLTACHNVIKACQEALAR